MEKGLNIGMMYRREYPPEHLPTYARHAGLG